MSLRGLEEGNENGFLNRCSNDWRGVGKRRHSKFGWSPNREAVTAVHAADPNGTPRIELLPLLLPLLTSYYPYFLDNATVQLGLCPGM
jgi:hypothetical protein